MKSTILQTGARYAELPRRQFFVKFARLKFGDIDRVILTNFAESTFCDYSIYYKDTGIYPVLHSLQII